MVDVGSLGGSAVVPRSRAIVRRMAKRILDLVIACVLLIALFPLLLGLRGSCARRSGDRFCLGKCVAVSTEGRFCCTNSEA